MLTVIFFLSSGLFLGWSLGANDAGNIFGTAIVTKMIRFRTAALIFALFVILGAVVSGAGATRTLANLGTIHTLPQAFTVALSAALAVFFMTRSGLPVSTSQAIIGAIIGWNFFADKTTDIELLTRIAGAWVLAPSLAVLFSYLLYLGLKRYLDHAKIHLFRRDSYTRIGLILIGAFGAYSLGANNIANVMGVFVTASPFKNLNIGGWEVLTGIQQLFLFGAIAIALGMYTYSHKVIRTVGGTIFKMSPILGLIVVLSTSCVLFLFSSDFIKDICLTLHLPSLPLVPVSSSQAAVGAVLGVGLAKKAQNIRYRALISIVIGWIFTPIIAATIAFIALYFMQNVFLTEVYGYG